MNDYSATLAEQIDLVQREGFTAEAVCAVLPSTTSTRYADGFFPGGTSLEAALEGIGWTHRWRDGSFRWCMTDPAGESQLTYVEGDLFTCNTSALPQRLQPLVDAANGFADTLEQAGREARGLSHNELAWTLNQLDSVAVALRGALDAVAPTVYDHTRAGGIDDAVRDLDKARASIVAASISIDPIEEWRSLSPGGR